MKFTGFHLLLLFLYVVSGPTVAFVVPAVDSHGAVGSSSRANGKQIGPAAIPSHDLDANNIPIQQVASQDLDEVEVEIDSAGLVQGFTIHDNSDPLNSGATTPVVMKDWAPEPMEEDCEGEVTSSCQKKEVAQLPAPRQADGVRSIQLGETVAMDDLGPMVVNSDGTLRRITNWDSMTKQEQANTLRLISARNKKRLAALQKNEHPSSNPVEDGNEAPSERSSDA